MNKRKGIEGISEKKKSSKKLVTIVMTAMIVFSLMPAFVPMAAAATVTAFTITPDTGTVCAKVAYNVSVNATTSWSKLNITIPAGFEMVAPTTSGDEIARAYLWNATGTNWTIIFTAGSTPATKVNVEGLNDTGVSSGAAAIFDIDYSPGGGVNVSSPWDGDSYANLTLPTATANGSLNVSLPGSMTLTNITLNMSGQYAKNPETKGIYTFDADGKTKAVTIDPAAPYKLWINASNPAPGVDYADIEVEVRDQYGNLNSTTQYSVTLIKNGSATVAAPNPNTTIAGKCTFNVSDSVNEPVLLKAMNSSLQTGEKVITFSGALHHLVVTLDKYTLYANNSDSATMTVQLKDASDQDLHASGTTINIAYANSTLLAVTLSSNQTDDNGQALFTVTAEGVAPATTDITMSESGGSSGTSDTITFKQAPNEGNSVFTTPTSIKAGETGAGAIITATLKDYNSALIKSSSEFPVTFNMTSGDGYFTDSAGAANYGTLKTIDSMDANGNASTYVYSTNASTTLKVNATVVNETGGDVQISTEKSIGVDPNVPTKLDISPKKSVGLKNVNGTAQDFTLQLQDTYGNDNTTDATYPVLITTDNEVLGNMTFGATTVNNNLWCNITADGNTTFRYTVNSSVEGTAELNVNVTDLGPITDTITVTTSGPTGLNLTVNPMLPLVGDTVTATAQLTSDVGDIAIAGVNITFILKNATNPYIEIFENYTDTTGKTTYSTTQTTRGEYTIKATNSSYSLSATNTTLTYVGNATNILIAVNETNPAVDETITVYAIFKDDAGYNSSSEDAPPGAAGVAFLANDAWFATDNTITNGVASATYSHDTEETVVLAVFFNNATKSLTLINSTSVEVGAPPPVCPWDLNGDETVSILDLIILTGHWGEDWSTGDFNSDNTISILDLIIMTTYWGPCPT